MQKCDRNKTFVGKCVLEVSNGGSSTCYTALEGN